MMITSIGSMQWVCGFANAHGGIIHIGKDDHGKVVGIGNHKKLMDEIPNKIRNQLGILNQLEKRIFKLENSR